MPHWLPYAFGSRSASALEKPKSSVAHQVGNGRHLPKTSAASPMKPMPFVIPSLNEWTKPSERYAPPIAAIAPEAMTAM